MLNGIMLHSGVMHKICCKTCKCTVTSDASTWNRMHRMSHCRQGEVCNLRAKAVGLMPHSWARLTYACTAAVTLGRGPYLDSASAYLPLYLFKRASFGPPSAERYFPCMPHMQFFDHLRTVACLPSPCAALKLPHQQAAALTQA